MAILVTGNTFVTGNQVTAATLNAAVNSSTFDTGAVDNSTTAVSGGAIIVKDGGVTMAKLASASNGQIPVGNGSGFTAATLTAGTNIGITNGAGSISVAFSGVLPVANGGTGGTLPVANGGTGVTTIAAYRTALALGAPIKNTSQLDRTDATYTDVPGLTDNLVSGTTYTVEIVAPWSTTSVATGFKLTGTATASSVSGVAHSVLGLSSFNTTLVSALPSTHTVSNAATTAGLFTSTATIVCNGSGTIKLQFAGFTGTSSVLLGATLKVFAY